MRPLELFPPLIWPITSPPHLPAKVLVHRELPKQRLSETVDEKKTGQGGRHVKNTHSGFLSLGQGGGKYFAQTLQDSYRKIKMKRDKRKPLPEKKDLSVRAQTSNPKSISKKYFFLMVIRIKGAVNSWCQPRGRHKLLQSAFWDDTWTSEENGKRDLCWFIVSTPQTDVFSCAAGTSLRNYNKK